MACRQVVGRGAAAIKHQPAQAHQPGPGTEPLLHGVGVFALVLLQLLVDAAELVVLLVHRIAGHQRFVFGVEQEHQPHQHGDQAAIELLGIPLRQFAQQFNVLPLAQLIGLLEAPQQIPQRRQHLIGQGIAHHRLEAAAFFEHIAQAVAIGIEEHMALPQQ